MRSTNAQDDPCRQPPSATLLAAVRQFNAGDYFICHETLEDLWVAEQRPLRRFYQGVLQIGVGLLHLQRGNENGARLLLEKGSQLLRPFLPVCQGLDLAALIEDAQKVLEQLNDSTPERPLTLGTWRPQIHLVEPFETPRR